MTVASKFSELLPEKYGYVILTGCASLLLNTWMGVNVSKARKTYDVQYPTMYSVTSKEFNCIQRVHQNTLEAAPHFLMTLFIGGLRYPMISTGAGAVYLIGRMVYAQGYYTGDPAKRHWGAFMHIGELVLLGNVISFAFQQLKLWPY